MKLTGGKLIIRTAWLSNSNFGIRYFKKISCPTNFRFLIQFVDLMIIKFSKIKMMVVEISFRLRLSGWCSDWITNWWRGGQIAPPLPPKKENRIVLCFKSLEWLITPRVISPRLDWFSCRYVSCCQLAPFSMECTHLPYLLFEQMTTRLLWLFWFTDILHRSDFRSVWS